MRPYRSGLKALLVGALVGTIVCGLTPPAGAATGYVMVDKWGVQGAGNGDFGEPSGVAVDASGDVYVADTGNSRIQKFSSTGTYIKQWGSLGSAYNQLTRPHGVAVADAHGYVFVTDTGNHRMRSFDLDGVGQKLWGGKGSEYWQFDSPSGAAVDGVCRVYVADTYNNRIQKFDRIGSFLLGSTCSLSVPHGVTVSPGFSVYVADTGNHRIQKLNSNLGLLGGWGSEGSGAGQFDSPHGVATDVNGNVYVADTDNHRIQKFYASGAFFTKWGTHGSGDGQLRHPHGVAVDASGNVYVADTGNHRIQKFSTCGVQPDMRTRLPGQSPWTGNNVYGPAGSQALAKSVSEGQTQVFELSVQNDGSVPDRYAISGKGFSGPWQIRYYTRLSGGTDITNQVTGTGGWKVSIAAGKARQFRAEITAADPEAGGSRRSSVVRAVSQIDGLTEDAVKIVLRVRNRWQPDARIKLPSESRWTGNNVYNETGAAQARSRTVGAGKTAVYRLSLQNDGNVKSRLHVTGPGSSGTWVVRYFDAWTGRTNITGAVTGAGWTTPALDVGKSQAMRVEVKPKVGTAAGARRAVRVVAASLAKPTLRDAVKAVTTVRSTTAAACQIAGLSAMATAVGSQITFTISSAAQVEARVLNLAGRPVATICRGRDCDAGTNTLLWDARSDQGLPVPNGTYLIEVAAKAEDGSQARALGQVRISR